jgi:hypothetical protein
VDPFSLNCSEFPNGCFAGEFPGVVDVLQVLVDGRDVHVEKDGHHHLALFCCPFKCRISPSTFFGNSPA